MGQPQISSVGINQPMGQPLISNAGFNQPAVGMNPLVGQSVVSNVGLMQQPAVPNMVSNAGFSQPLGQTGVSNTGLSQPVGQGPKQGVNYSPVVTNSVFDNAPKAGQFKLILFNLLNFSFVSSPEPLGSQGKLLVYPSSRRPSVLRTFTIFKDLLL